MKTKLVQLSVGKVAVISYSIKTGYCVFREMGDSMQMLLTIAKVGSKREEGDFVKGLEIGSKVSTLLPDLQLYINSSEPILGTTDIKKIEFLTSEYYREAFVLHNPEFMQLQAAIDELKTPIQYTKAEEFYNDLIEEHK